MEILLLSGPTLGYSSDMTKTTVDQLMIWKLWKEPRNKFQSSPLMLTNKLALTI